MRWPHFGVFRKISKKLFLIQIHNRFIFVYLCKNRKDTKHLNNFSRCIMFGCDLEHRRFVSVLCVLNKIRCNHLHPLYSALPVPVWVTRSRAHRYTCAPPRCRTSRISGLLFSCQYLCGTILMTPCSMVWDWRVSRAWPMPCYWPSCSLTLCLLLFSHALLSFHGLVLLGWGLSSHALPTFFNNNNKLISYQWILPNLTLYIVIITANRKKCHHAKLKKNDGN